MSVKIKNELSLRSRRKRQSILQAAAAEFDERGFAGANMDRIAQRAEVSKRTVYNHFESKHALFSAIVDHLESHAEYVSSFPYSATDDLHGQVEYMVASVAALLTTPSMRQLSRVIIRQRMVGEKLPIKSAASPDVFRKGIIDWIEQANADGRLEVKDPRLAAYQMTSLIDGVVWWPVLIQLREQPDKEELDLLVQETTRMFLARYAVSNG